MATSKVIALSAVRHECLIICDCASFKCNYTPSPPGASYNAFRDQIPNKPTSFAPKEITIFQEPVVLA